MSVTSRRTLTVAAGAAAALVLWAVVYLLAGVELTTKQASGPQPDSPIAVAGASLLIGLAAWGLLVLLERKVTRPARTWTIIALVVLAASMIGPVGEAADTATMLTLIGLHLIVAAVLIPGLALSARRQVAGEEV